MTSKFKSLEIESLNINQSFKTLLSSCFEGVPSSVISFAATFKQLSVKQII